jgi:phosphatidylserine/phosphatidylglycerophosphate/cardiolipin synthase-like enzyme
MRRRSKNKYISVHAISGTEVVLLGLDATEEAAEGLLGFTIYRRRGKTGKKTPLGGGKIFKGVHHENERGRLRSDKAPIQLFMWSDFVVDPGETYTYTVIPRYGIPGSLEPESNGVEVTIKTEHPDEKTHAVYFNRGVAGSEAYSRKFGKFRKWYLIEDPGREKTDDTGQEEDGGAVAEENVDEVPQARPLIKPSEVPKREAHEWLSRGLEEAMLGFIAQAKGKGYALRAAVYELTYDPVIQAFVDALERGADVQIVHHAKRQSVYRLKGARAKKGEPKPAKPVTTTEWSDTGPIPFDAFTERSNKYVVEERFKDDVCKAAVQAVGRIGLKDPSDDLLKAFNNMLIQRQNTQISHNKFIVLLKNNKPVQVWFGSTNFTAGGIFGQSNVGHVVRDPKIAKKYYDYWKQLSKDPEKKRMPNDPMRNWTVKNTPDLEGLPPKNSMTPIFSPRATEAMLQWYADRIAAAKNSVFFTLAFSVDESFLKILAKSKKVGDEPYQRYVLLETRKGKMWEKFKIMDDCPQNRVAWGDTLKPRDTEQEPYHQFIETLTGLNSHVEYLHTKYMLVDPLSEDPIVITGSANFSEASTTKNDENMMIIRGNTRVADIFLGEFMRLFNHFRSRNVRNKMSKRQAERRHYLTPNASWTKPYYKAGSQEHNERLLFR